MFSCGSLSTLGPLAHAVTVEVAVNLFGPTQRKLCGYVLCSHIRALGSYLVARDIFLFVRVSSPYFVFAEFLDYSRAIVNV